MPLFSAKSETPEHCPAKGKTLNCWFLIEGRLNCDHFSIAVFTGDSGNPMVIENQVSGSDDQPIFTIHGCLCTNHRVERTHPKCSPVPLVQFRTLEGAQGQRKRPLPKHASSTGLRELRFSCRCEVEHSKR